MIMSYTEGFFGVGFMVGPALVALLYNYGGFLLPFLTSGILGLVVATAMIFIVPNVEPDTPEDRATRKRLGFRAMAKVVPQGTPALYFTFLARCVSFTEPNNSFALHRQLLLLFWQRAFGGDAPTSPSGSRRNSDPRWHGIFYPGCSVYGGHSHLRVPL